ncbi:hydrogenase isoenzymes formation protein HypD [Moorella thermoacetica]|nr:hydrogenase isoenzymes formation protein HypD [Moorella thermoacetica]
MPVTLMEVCGTHAHTLFHSGIRQMLPGWLVSAAGNLQARTLVERVFTLEGSTWRGLGAIPASSLVIKLELAANDARRIYGLAEKEGAVPPGCLCGDILKGKKAPPECPLFKRLCRTYRPVGPCTVSSEGTCSAYLNTTHEGECRSWEIRFSSLTAAVAIPPSYSFKKLFQRYFNNPLYGCG